MAEKIAVPNIIESPDEYETALNTVALLAVKGRGRTRAEERLFRTWALLIENYDRRRRSLERRLQTLPPKPGHSPLNP